MSLKGKTLDCTSSVDGGWGVEVKFVFNPILKVDMFTIIMNSHMPAIQKILSMNQNESE